MKLNEMITVKISDLKENKIFSELVPEMTTAEYDDLVASIRKNGLQQPIHILKDKSILDGRHRVRACKEIGIKEIQALSHELDETKAIEFVVDTAVERRSLTKEQKLDIILRSIDLLDGLKNEAIIRQQQTQFGNKSGGGPLDHHHEKGKTDDKLGELAGVSGRTVRRMRKVKNEDPEKYKEVLEGKKSIRKAHDELPTVKKPETKPKTEPKPKPKLIIPEPEPMEPDEMKLFQAVDNLDFNMNQIIHYVKDNEEKLYEAICQTYDERPEFMEQAHKSIEVLHNLMNAYIGGKYNEQKI